VTKGFTHGFVAIGASGSRGLRDIRELLAALPRNLDAVVVVLHRPWAPPSHLRPIFAQVSKMPVVIASDGERLRAGVVYIGEPHHADRQQCW
jgi:two-component system chemotaxis response regulator CheB